MRTLTVDLSKSVVYAGGKTGYGGVTNYGNGTWEYTLRLSAKAASLVEDGDIIGYADYGASEMSHQDCRGVIYKPSIHKVIALQGSRDNGIHTGHPTHLGLVMTKTPQLNWKRLENLDNYPKLPRAGYNLDLSQEDVDLYLKKLNFILPPNQKMMRYEGINQLIGFGYFKKVIQMTSTDIPSTMILEEIYQGRDPEQIPFAYFQMW
jgi:hypothetical protein